MDDTAAATERTGAFRRLYHWILRNAEGPYAYGVLALVAFAEASFFPMLPDVVMAPMILANRARALRITAWCVLWSIVGAAFGYAIGSIFYQAVGHWLVGLMGLSSGIDSLRLKFARNAWLIVVVGLVTPFKLVSISSGIAAVPFVLFMFYAALSRSIRFSAVGVLLYIFGEPVRAFLDRRLEQALLALFVLVVAVVVALRYSVRFLG